MKNATKKRLPFDQLLLHKYCHFFEGMLLIVCVAVCTAVDLVDIVVMAAVDLQI